MQELRIVFNRACEHLERSVEILYLLFISYKSILLDKSSIKRLYKCDVKMGAISFLGKNSRTTDKLYNFLSNFHSNPNGHIITLWNIYINLACLSVCLSVCLFVSNKRQNCWTDRAQIFCVTSRDHREGLWTIKISNICLHQNSIFIKLLKILKIHEIFC